MPGPHDKPLPTFEGQASPWSGEGPTGHGGGGRGGSRAGWIFVTMVLLGALGAAIAWAFSLSGRLEASENRAASREGETREQKLRLSRCLSAKQQAEEAHSVCERALGPARKAIEDRLATIGRDRCEAAGKLVGELGKLQEAGKLRLWQSGARLRLVARDTVLFEEASSRVSPGGKGVLAAVAAALALEPRAIVTVVGQADFEPPARAQGTPGRGSSWEVAASRAAALANALVVAGLPPARLSTRGLGVGSPRASAPGIAELGDDRVELEIELGAAEREAMLVELSPPCAPAWTLDGGARDGAARD
jgi:flagellar motor protein MotB